MVKKFLNFFNLSDEDEDNYDDDYYDDDAYEDSYSSRKSSRYEASEEKESSRSSSRDRRNTSRNTDTDDTNVSQFEAARRERAAKNKHNNVVSYKKESRTTMEVCIKKPNSYEDATQICDLLMDGVPVVVSLEGFDSAEAQRTMEFICGCIYALHGDMRQIQKYTFIFSPADININGDFNVTDGAIPTFSTEY